MYINNPGRMTKIAAMSIYGKSPSKSSPEPVDQFPKKGTGRQRSGKGAEKDSHSKNRGGKELN